MRSYARSLSEGQEELTVPLTTGTSDNHLIAVIIALMGGLLWEHMGIELLFSAVALFGLESLFFTMT